jgi:hypothetical protein
MHLSYRNAPLWYLPVITNSDAVKQDYKRKGLVGKVMERVRLERKGAKGLFFFLVKPWKHLDSQSHLQVNC